MAADVSGTTLIGRIRDLGGYRDPFITDAMLLGWINDSLAQLWEIIIKYDPGRALQRDTIDWVAGEEKYDLPDDFFRVKGVAVEDSSSASGWSRLERYMWPERHDASPGSDKLSALWDVQEGQLYLVPKPGWSAQVLVEYFQIAPVLDDAADTFDSINYWTEWVVFDVLVKCALKGDDDAKGWAIERDRREALIRGSTPQVNGGGPKTAVSIYERGRSSRYRGRLRW